MQCKGYEQKSQRQIESQMPMWEVIRNQRERDRLSTTESDRLILISAAYYV